MALATSRPTAVGYPPTAVGYPPTAVGYPRTAVGYPPTAIGYPPTAVGYPPTNTGYRQPGAVHNPCPRGKKRNEIWILTDRPGAACGGRGGGGGGASKSQYEGVPHIQRRSSRARLALPSRCRCMRHSSCEGPPTKSRAAPIGCGFALRRRPSLCRQEIGGAGAHSAKGAAAPRLVRSCP